MKYLFVIVVMLVISSCSRVGTGEIGIVLGWDKQIKSEPVVNGIEVHILDDLIVIDGTQIRVPVENVKAKDIDGILFQDIDAQVTYNISPKGAVEFYTLTKEIDVVKDGEGLFGENTVGFRVVGKEAKNALVKAFTQFKANQVNTEKSTVEAKLSEMLSEELERRYPKTFTIVDVNIDAAQLDPNVEKVLQSQALLDSEKRTMSSKTELQIKQSELLDKEITDMRTTASKAGISVSDLMKYKNDKERNRVLSELARNGSPTQLQIKE
jgi:hypothetical protein